MMSKKHYQMIADEIDSARSAFRNSPESRRALRFLAKNLADTLTEKNPRFDRTRFLDACGFPQGIGQVRGLQHYGL